jgi:hypothetical protein
MAFDLSSWVRENEAKYKEAFESVTLDNEEVPEGEYRVKVESAISKESKAGNEMVELKFRVLDGKYKNRLIWKHYSLDGEDSIKRFGKDLLRCGESDLKWSEFKGAVERLLDKELKIAIKINVKGDQRFRNVYIIKKLSSFESILNDSDLPF